MICWRISKLIEHSDVRGGAAKITTKSNIDRSLGCRYLFGRLQYWSTTSRFSAIAHLGIQELLSD